MSNFEEKILKRESKYKGKILNVDFLTVELPNGGESTREVLTHNGAVAILGVTENEEVILVEQYRIAVDQNTLEIPAGKLEKGENPIECAVREMREETGYNVNKEDLEIIYKMHPAIGYSSEVITIYYVEDLRKQETLDLDEDEFLNCKKYKLKDIFVMLENNLITDSKTLVALEWLKNKKGK